ncbi:putative flagellar hook-length control protein [Legionella quinlivanii]|uniref:Putative flagellar hook-length control protein n=1 Tax=Legionella quinlivanii TaxID=45073 RepID=A0A0W0XZA9_9GAMM|nr:flagellar hook-length control protein FliK [Legionella quinlivanii]KTD50044.1 putative flagellar hook-length control protein [Legionella quinlivanii]MCW8450652.1 flagellar hook-length control protein FliK [Legionella quinlivanii]SEF93626.1 hook-length control protein FliK [Legionella quinlivanii DSM 21216]STY11180.1 flagellar hook-length control protein FliK [Legionella quinlivanii]
MINQIPPDPFFMVPDDIPPLEASGDGNAEATDISNYFLELITDYLSEGPIPETKPVEDEISLPVEQEPSPDSNPKEVLELPLDNPKSVEPESEDDDKELPDNPALAWLNAIHNETLTIQEVEAGGKPAEEHLSFSPPVSDKSFINHMQNRSLSPPENNNQPQKVAADIEFAPIDVEEKSEQTIEIEVLTNQIIQVDSGSEDQSIDPQKNLNADIKEIPLRVIKPDFASSHSESKTSASAANRFEISSEVNEGGWQDDFNARVTWLGQHKINQAVIKLNPVELGPVEVKIHLSEETAKIDFNTHSLQVQDLIEQSIPRLREMLMSQGLQLSEVNIETGDRRSRSQTAHQPDEALFQNQEEEASVVTRQTKGIVDFFA